MRARLFLRTAEASLLALVSLFGASSARAAALDLPADDPAVPTTSPDEPAKAPAPPKLVRPKTILMTANEVVARTIPKLLERPADTSARISVSGGLLGIGGYDAHGGSGFGLPGPPLVIFPRAGAGNSLNIDPVTGKMR
jgi:hypothetical protein